MKQWTRVRQRVLRDKQSKRSVMREEGLHWETLEKMLAHSRPPGYRRKKRRGRKIDPYVGWIEEVLKADRNMPRKQRHTAKRIYERLGGRRTTKGAIRRSRRRWHSCVRGGGKCSCLWSTAPGRRRWTSVTPW